MIKCIGIIINLTQILHIIKIKIVRIGLYLFFVYVCFLSKSQ